MRPIATTMATWAEVRQDQAASREAQLDEGGLDPEWLAELDDRLDEETDTSVETVEASLAIWADFRRRQGEAAAARLEEDGLDPEWLAALNRRLDDCPTEEASARSDPRLVAARISAHNGIATLVEARSNSDDSIRSMANQALRSCLWMSLPCSGTDDGVGKMMDVVDATVRTLSCQILKRDIGRVDGPERGRAQRTRWMFITFMVVASAAGAAAMALGYYALSLGLLGSAVVMDVLEGSVGRVTATETPVGRWASCLLGHLAEYVFVAAIAGDQLRQGHAGMAFVLLGAVVVAQYGTFVRTSARLVGDKPSLSMKERAVRFTAIFGYGTLSFLATVPLLGPVAGVAPVVTAVMFGGFGLWETRRVGAAMRRRTVKSIVTIVEADGNTESFVVDRAACLAGGIY